MLPYAFDYRYQMLTSNDSTYETLAVCTKAISSNPIDRQLSKFVSDSDLRRKILFESRLYQLSFDKLKIISDVSDLNVSTIKVWPLEFLQYLESDKLELPMISLVGSKADKVKQSIVKTLVNSVVPRRFDVGSVIEAGIKLLAHPEHKDSKILLDGEIDCILQELPKELKNLPTRNRVVMALKKAETIREENINGKEIKRKIKMLEQSKCMLLKIHEYEFLYV